MTVNEKVKELKSKGVKNIMTGKEAMQEQLILELLKRVENLEKDVAMLTSRDYHDESHAAYGAAIQAFYASRENW